MNSSIRSDSFSGPINEVRAASTAAGGTALTTTAAIVPLPNGTTHVGVIARNFTTAVVMKFAVNPYLLILKSTDSLASTTDFSSQGQQVGGTGVSLNAFPTLVNGGMLYIGSHLPFRGFKVAMSASVNAVVATMLGEFWNGSIWTTLSITDGTASGGAPLAQSGNVTWTMPTTWVKEFANQTTPTPQDISLKHQMPYADKARFWTRFSVSAALSATVLINTMFAFNRSTAYGEAVQDSLLQFRATKGVDGVSCMELLTDAGTASAIVNAYVASGSGAF